MATHIREHEPLPQQGLTPRDYLRERVWSTLLDSPPLFTIRRLQSPVREGQTLLARYDVPCTPQFLSAFTHPSYQQLRRTLLTQHIPASTRHPLLLDAAFYLTRNQHHKVELLHHVLRRDSPTPSTAVATVQQLAPLLRQVDNEDIQPILACPIDSPALVEVLREHATQTARRFYTQAASLPINWAKFTKHYTQPLAQVAQDLLSTLGIPTKSCTIQVGSGETLTRVCLPVPRDFATFRRAHQVSSDQYFPAMTHYLYQQLTTRNPLPVVETTLIRLLRQVYTLDLEALPSRAKQEAGLTRNLWTFLLDQLNAHPQQKYLLWLNESTTPRYFGRDEVAAAFAKRIGMVQHIEDRTALEFLGANRKTLRQAASLIRHGNPLPAKQAQIVRQLQERFGLSPTTRVLPLHEVKLKSGRNDHQIQTTAPVMDDLIDLAEVLGMHILFADISANRVGRSQRYLKAFMQTRGIPTRASGRLIQGFAQDTPEDEIVNEVPIGEVFRSVPPDRNRSMTRVVVIQYDPNDEQITPTADDAKWLTVRNRINRKGLYVPTRAPAVIPQLTGFITAEEHWRRLIVPEALADLIASLRLSQPLPKLLIPPPQLPEHPITTPTNTRLTQRTPWQAWPRLHRRLQAA